MEKNIKQHSSEITRRKFFKRMSMGAVGGGLMISGLYSQDVPKAFAENGNSKIVRLFNPDATDDSDEKNNDNVSGHVVEEMVNAGIKSFTGYQTVEQAWSQIIPDNSKKVAILVNLEKTGNFTKYKTVKPITDGLIASGVPSDNIVIYWKGESALSNSGFVKNTGAGIKMGAVNDLGGYSSYHHPEISFTIANLIKDPSSPYYCDYIINVPCLKALDGYSGITGCMKNHYGTCSPSHDDIMTRIPFYNSLPEIKDKTRLIVLDALYCEFVFGWGSQRNTVMSKTNKILFSSDPVALDYLCWEMIEAQRSEHGRDPVDPQPEFISNASATYNLGTDNPDRIDITDITTGITPSPPTGLRLST